MDNENDDATRRNLLLGLVKCAMAAAVATTLFPVSVSASNDELDIVEVQKRYNAYGKEAEATTAVSQIEHGRFTLWPQYFQQHVRGGGTTFTQR